MIRFNSVCRVLDFSYFKENTPGFCLFASWTCKSIGWEDVYVIILLKFESHRYVSFINPFCSLAMHIKIIIWMKIFHTKNKINNNKKRWMVFHGHFLVMMVTRAHGFVGLLFCFLPSIIHTHVHLLYHIHDTHFFPFHLYMILFGLLY